MQMHDRMLAKRLIDGLASVPGVRILGLTRTEDLARRVPTVSFDLAGHDPVTIARFMAADGINIGSGHTYGVEPITRLGLLEKGGILWIRARPAAFNIVDSEGIQLLGNTNLVEHRERNSGALRPVTQSRVVEGDWLCAHEKRPPR
jgi:selenocysteine lyase/cysteine desulfurase